MKETGVDILPIYKYTKREWAEDFLKRGRIYLSTASSLNDPLLNAAIRDDELVVNAITDDLTTRVFQVNQETFETEKQIPTIGDIKLTLELAKPVDYYVMCFSMEYNRQTLAQFEEYDTCIVIRDHERFARAVYSEFERYAGRWRCLAEPVQYYDPRSIEQLPKSVFFHKDQEYAYQHTGLYCIPMTLIKSWNACSSRSGIWKTTATSSSSTMRNKVKRGIGVRPSILQSPDYS